MEVGQPDDKPLLKACGRADQVVLYCFASTAEIWWRGIETRLTRPQNLSVMRLPSASAQALVPMAQRSMQLQATIQEGVSMLNPRAGNRHRPARHND